MKEKIYKIGKSGQERCKRVKDYPPGSEGIVMEQVSDLHKAEKTLIGRFKKIFIQRLDIGREFFEGDVKIMKKHFREICDDFVPCSFNEEFNDISRGLANLTLDYIFEKYQKHLFVLKNRTSLVLKIKRILVECDYCITGIEDDCVFYGNIEREFIHQYPDSILEEETEFGNISMKQLLKMMVWNEAFRLGNLRCETEFRDEINTECVVPQPDSWDKPLIITGIKFRGSIPSYNFSNLSRDAERVSKTKLGRYTLSDFLKETIPRKNIVNVIKYIQSIFVVGSSDVKKELMYPISLLQEGSDMNELYIYLTACLILGYSVTITDENETLENYLNVMFISVRINSLDIVKKHTTPTTASYYQTKNQELKLLEIKREHWASSEQRRVDQSKIRFLEVEKLSNKGEDDWKWYYAKKSTKKIIRKHLKLRGQMEMLWKLFIWILDQIIIKKGIKNPFTEFFSSPKPFYFSKQTTSFYHKYSSMIDNLYKPFSELKIIAHELLSLELCGKMEEDKLSLIYYGHYKKPTKLKFDSFVYKDWLLDEDFDLTEQDSIIISNFRNLVVNFIEECIKITAEISTDDKDWETRKQNYIKTLTATKDFYNKTISV